MPTTTPPADDHNNDDDKKRRPRGDGGLRWSESRKRWIAEVTIGYTPAGKRIVRSASDRHKSKALKKLHEKLRDRDDGLPSEDTRYTVAQAVNDWLEFGLNGRDENTLKNRRSLAENHVIPDLGSRRLRELTADDVDRWLAAKSKTLSTKTLRELRSVLKRAVDRAQARDRVKRNVVLLCEVPQGQPGRPSKALSFAQAEALLSAAEQAEKWLFAYIVLSLLTGARTEEVRALRWSHVVAYDQERQAWTPVHQSGWVPHEEFAIYVWRSVRKGGDTKTMKSRRSLRIPWRCVWALADLWDAIRAAGTVPEPDALVFPASNGQERDPMSVLRAFRKVVGAAGLVADDWSTRELRHSFVSLLSDNGMASEKIARLVGHSSTIVTETVYRQQIRPVIEDGATAMNRIFPGKTPEP